MGLTKNIFQEGIQKKLPSWLKATKNVIDNVWDDALKVAGTADYGNFVEQTAKDISTDAFERKVESAINAKYAGKFKNSTLRDISVNIWNADVDKVYAFKTDKELGNFIYQGLEDYGNRGFSNYVDYVEQGLAKKGVAGSLTKEELATLNDVKSGLFDTDWKYGKLKGNAKKKVNARIDDLAAAREKAWYESANNAADEYAALQEADKAAARAEARKATAAVTDADTRNVLKPRTEQLRQEARAEQLKGYRSPDSPYGNIDTEGLPERLKEYKSPESPYSSFDTELDDAVTKADLTDDIIYEQRAYRQQQVNNLSKIGQKPAEITASLDVPKSEGFTVNGPFPPTEAKTGPSFTLQSAGATGLGTNAAAFDQPILNANKGFDYSKFSTTPEVSKKKIITTAGKESGKFNSTNFTRALTGKDVTTAGGEAAGIGIKHAVGAIAAAGGLMTLFSSTGGQQNNAQLYGQQPLY